MLIVVDFALIAVVVVVTVDPSAWSKDDVKGWLSWTCRQCNLGPLPLERFHMEGESLVALTEEEFRLAAPQGTATGRNELYNAVLKFE